MIDLSQECGMCFIVCSCRVIVAERACGGSYVRRDWGASKRVPQEFAERCGAGSEFSVPDAKHARSTHVNRTVLIAYLSGFLYLRSTSKSISHLSLGILILSSERKNAFSINNTLMYKQLSLIRVFTLKKTLLTITAIINRVEVKQISLELI